MKQICKKIVCIMLAIALVVPVLQSNGMNVVKASNSTKLNRTSAVINKGATFQLSFSKLTNATITWSSDNTSVATVDANGLVTGIDEGSATINAKVNRAGSTYEEIYSCIMRVKTPEYIPSTPYNETYLVGKDIKAGEYVIFSDGSESKGAYWGIYNKAYKEVLSNAFTRGTAIITVEKNQRLKINNGYAVPIKKVAKSTFNINKLNNMYDFTAKVGYGFSAGTYKVTKADGVKGNCYAIVYSSNKSPLYKKQVKYYFGKKSYKVTVKKGQYLVVTSGTIKKVK